MVKPAYSVLAFTLAMLLLPRIAAAQESPAFPSVPAAIQALGDDEFAIRQRASDFLWRAGAPALGALESAARSSDPEVKLRATTILRNVRLGITPDTPPELQSLVTLFYEGDRNARQRVINELRQKGAFKTIFGLLQHETDPTTRQLFFGTLQSDLHRLAPQMIASNDWTLLEQWLELGKNNDSGRAQFVAYALLRGKLPEQLTKAQEAFEKDKTNASAALLLAALLRAAGDEEKAFAVATSGMNASSTFVQGMCRERGDWERLLDFYATKADVPRAELHRLGIRATCLRLAGKEEETEQAFQDLMAAGPSDDVWYAGKVALLNDRASEALDMLATTGLRPMAFDLYVQRQQHAEALKLVGITEETRFDNDWLTKLTGEKSVRTSRTVDRFAFAVSIAAELRMLGRRKQFEELQALLLATATADDARGQYWQQLGRLERYPGRQREMLDRYGRSADRNHHAVLAAVFGKKNLRALSWWTALEGDARWADPRARLCAVAVAMQPATYARQVEVDWPAVVKVATEKAADPALPAAQRAGIFTAIAEAWLARGDKVQAEKNWRAGCLADPSAAEAYGDTLFAEQRWGEAAAQYAQSAEANQGNPVAWYLQGIALIRAGKKEAGEKLQETANLMCLDSPSRYNLALGIQERGVRDQALEQWQLLQKTGNPDDQMVSIANQHIGNIVAEKEPLAAARHWEQLRFHLLRPTSNLVDQSGYLDIATALHRTRARGLLAKGSRQEALRSTALCEELLPGSIKTVEELAPLLRKAGLSTEADKLVDNAYRIYRGCVEQFPDSATMHNQAAWVAAINVRHLDEALKLAERAVELSPDSPSYTDTLAEVYFARGDREQALHWARKAAELEPDGKFYAERLKSFETRELPKRP